jgi:MHS family shikimate/dehydroshikimate transporter-like MFS transporter
MWKTGSILEPSTQKDNARRAMIASFVGAVVEWYDFFLYGTAASVVFGSLFFPKGNATVGTLAAFATFAVGYAVRPIGGALFGHLGDRTGRKATLVITVLLMGGSTTLIGVLPTYQSVGLAAPLLLVLLRVLQGLAVGGEWGGAVLMAVEHAPAEKRGLFGSSPQLGAPAGLLLSTGAFTLFSLLPHDQFMKWGWRVPFLISAVLVVVGLRIRLKVSESPAFLEMKQQGAEAKRPLLTTLAHPRRPLVIAGLRFIEGVPSSIYAFFATTYVVNVLHLHSWIGSVGVAIAAFFGLGGVLTSGWLSDKIGRRRMYFIATCFAAVIALPVFALMGTKVTVLIWLALVLGMSAGVYMVFGPQAALFSEIFDTSVRYSGASLGYQIGGALTSGLSPLIAASLLARFNNSYVPIGLLIIGSAVVSLLALWWCPRAVMRQPEAVAVDAGV